MPSNRFTFAALLAGLAMLGPFSIDTYMPSFPEIGQTFGATPLQLQFTISAFLAPFAVMALFHGALADSFGRRPAILINLAMFSVASAGCAMAQMFHQLLWFRALQGFAGGAGMIVGRAMIRDSFAGDEAQRMMSTVTMIFGLAPALPWAVLCVMLYTAGMAIAMPTVTLLALDLFPHNRGMAASVQAFQHSMFTAVTAVAIVPHVAESALAVALTAAALLTCGVLCAYAYLRMPAFSESRHA